MKRSFTLAALAVGLTFAASNAAQAQVALTLGNPYNPRSMTVGSAGGNLFVAPGGVQGWNQGALNQGAWGQPGWNQGGWNQPGWNQGGWNQPGLNQQGWNQAGWNQNAWNQRPVGFGTPAYGNPYGVGVNQARTYSSGYSGFAAPYGPTVQGVTPGYAVPAYSTPYIFVR